MAEKRRIIQFFIKGDLSLVLCSDNTVFSFREDFHKGNEIIVWKRRKDIEDSLPQD